MHWNSGHDELHATSFACSVLSVAVLSKVAPFPVAAEKPVLVEEAHVSDATWVAIVSLCVLKSYGVIKVSTYRDKLLLTQTVLQVSH